MSLSLATRDIVVIGASAGGVEALETLIAQLPADFTASIFVVLHLAPRHPTHLPRILERAGALPAVAAVDGQRFEAGHIYTAPPDRHLLLEGCRLRLTAGPRENRARPSIDTLFRSAAFCGGPRVVGVVLSGVLDDGTAGLWAIKDRGGVAAVQHPEEARYPSMPQSAIAHVRVDHVAPIAKLGPLLVKLTSEDVAMSDWRGAPESMAVENQIALGADAFETGAMRVGALTRLTCPECQGTLVKVDDGSSLTCPRCHTGPAHTLHTLLADVEQSLEYALWSVVRGIEERLLILRQLREAAQRNGNAGKAERYEKAIFEAQQRHDALRQLIVETPKGGFGQSSARA